ncbi:MAG: SDR family oxidoreductase [Spirochaetes bacterium]|nr:MAG: SDR family oxidoreductase [Spirochaetota bacterium]
MRVPEVTVRDKVALVTGASRGIGEAVARTLGVFGAKLILVSRKMDDLKKVQRDIGIEGGKAECFAVNTGEMDQINDLFKQLREKYPKIDILVNNAATNPFFGDVLSADERAWDKTLAVNLKGCFFMAQHAAKWMKEKNGGCIVNVSSVNGIRPAPMQGIYSITKAGLIALTKSFAKELAPFNIRVNAVLPGLTDTKFSAAITNNEDIMKLVLPSIPMGRFARPDEMAGTVLYLCSDAATYTTGSCIVVDGGMLA